METSTLVANLRSNGIKASQYFRTPEGSRRSSFYMRVRPGGSNGEIIFWAGKADIEIYPDKKRRQAVLVVSEKKRTMSRKVSYYRNQMSLAELERMAINNFRRNVSLPKGTRYKATVSNSLDAFGKHRINVTATIPASKQSFLIGIDENYHFVCLLPKHTKSVEHAHKLLRPSGLSKDAIRVGEWFFDPNVPAATIKNKSISINKINRHGATLLRSVPMERESSHRYISGCGFRQNGTLYVRGLIFDTRSNRHEPIFLEKWHKVVRNKEVKVKAQVTNWD